MGKGGGGGRNLETKAEKGGGREVVVSQTVRKRVTRRIKWYRNETIVEQMPGHKTTASSFPPPIGLHPPLRRKPTSVSPNGSRQTAPPPFGV